MVLFILLLKPIYAQPHFEFSGYVIDLPIYQNLNIPLLRVDEDLYLNLNRVRLRPTVNFNRDTRISLEYEIISLYQNAQTLFDNFQQQVSRQTFDWRWNLANEQRFTAIHFIDRLYFRHDFYIGNLVIGRQRVAWGTGRIWNPTDLFNPINPASFQKIEKDGADLITTQFYFGRLTDLEIVYNPQEKLADNNAGFRFRSNFKPYDFAMMGGYFDQRIVLGGDFAGNLLTAGFRGEGIISANKNDLNRNFVKFIVGLDFQFTSKLYTLIEYQFNGEGSTDPREYDLFALLDGDIINLSKNYIYFQSNYQLHPLLNTSFAYNANLNDGSGFFFVNAQYSVTENFYLSFGGQLFYGDKLDEYWYYPNSVFLQGEFYF